MLALQQFRDFINEHRLFAQNDRILLAISGGKDSVLMLHFFYACGFKISLAHCNFNLRGDESRRDENFVKKLAEDLNLQLHVAHFDTKKYANEHKVSTQMAARTLRYQWFEEIRATENYQYIALAQHQNDATETVLVNLLRGTGIGGLHGILPKRGHLIRPLLFLTRTEIDALVAENKFDFVEDSSNSGTHYTRNKLRLEVIPKLKEINPNLEKTFTENMARFAAVEEFLNLQVAQIREEITHHRQQETHFALEDLQRLKPQKLLLFELLRPYNFTESVINDLLSALDSGSGKQFFSQSHLAVIDRKALIITKIQAQNQLNLLLQAHEEAWCLAHASLSLRFAENVSLAHYANKAFVDAAQLIFPLHIRYWKNGDKFFPIGMKKPKKISDFFIDEKIPLHQKNNIPILFNGNGQVIWIMGLRLDNRYKLTPTTKKVAIFELKNK